MPVTGVVAIAALVAAATVVCVILSVTIKALRWRIRECAVFVAVEAGRLLVLSEQRIVRGRVVEFGLQPLRRFVAADAVAAHPVLVRFVFLVAIDAVRGRLPVFSIRRVAVFAFCVLVRSQQFKVSETMIERCLVKNDDDRITTLVFGMTGGALVGLNFGAFPVVSVFLIDVFCDIFVAIETELPLCFFVESFVAGGTLILQVRVSLDDIAGHDQRLNVLS